MNIKESEFWSQLKKITAADDHVEVPQACLESAFAIFQPPATKMPRLNIFSLRPAFTGMVRRGEGAKKLFFELGEEHIVQLEKSWDDDGVHLTGFAHGFDEIPVVLYGQESVFETRIESGEFEFRSLPSGTYSMSFTDVDGEDYWIKDLELSN